MMPSGSTPTWPIKELWDQGNAIIQGVGYPNPVRSHFRSMDIWHTCEPDKVGTEGWLGRAIRDIDPHKENVLTGVNFGRGLPRALAAPGVPVASVGNLETYGVLTGIEGADQRSQALDLFAKMYSSKLGSSLVREYISQTGTDALSGADILSSTTEVYLDGEVRAIPCRNTCATSPRCIWPVFGTKILYTTAPQNSFDTHATEMAKHPSCGRTCPALSARSIRTWEHNASPERRGLSVHGVGRRVHDNGSGTDHGSGGIAFVIGDAVKGGLRGVPSLAPEKLLEGDLHYNDFRSTYATLLEQWMGLDAKPIVGGSFEQLAFLCGR